MKKINRKLFVKETGKEFNFGDYFTLVKGSLPTPLTLVIDYLIEGRIHELIDNGILVEKLVEEPTNLKEDNKEDNKKEEESFSNWGMITHIADRVGWSLDYVEEFLRDLLEVYPAAVYSTLLKEVALIFDEVHKTPIRESTEIWIVNSFNNRVERVNNPKNIVSFGGFAAFRSKEEAIAGRDCATKGLQLLKEKYEMWCQ